MNLIVLKSRIKFFLSNIIDIFSVYHTKTYDKRHEEKVPKKKYILIFNWRDTRHKYAGGAEVYIHELSKRWVQKGHSVTLFCGNDGNCKRNEVIDGVQIIRRGGFYFVYVWAWLYYLLRLRNRYDVILDCENGIPFFAPVYSKEKVICLMFHVHKEVFHRSMIKPIAQFASFLESYVFPRIYKNIEFITISKSSKKEMENIGIGKAGIHIVHPGTDINRISSIKKLDNPMILYVGRLKYYKSVDVVIKAASKVIKNKPNCRFVIAGDGEEMRNLKSLVKELNLENHVQLLGKVDHQKKLELMHKAWIFVNPSFMEGWGITNIEANACGTPVVASDVPGLRDSVNPEKNGLLAEYGNVKDFSDKMLKIINDQDLREKLSTEAIQWANQFDWQTSANQSIEYLV